MINFGLVSKAGREAWISTLLFGLGLFVIEGILAIALPRFFEQAGPLLRMPFFQNILRALLGTDLGGNLAPVVFVSFAWVHPAALAILWTHEIVFCTRFPVGEIDRGTVDVLLGWPVSRWQVYLSETVVWLVAGMIILGMGLLGSLLGCASLSAQDRPGLGQLLRVVLNLYFLYIAVGGAAYLVSTLSDRRGRAVGVIFAIVLSSFFLNFLAQFWEPAQKLLFLSLLNYYRPFVLLQGGSWPLSDMLILGVVGAGCWAAGGICLGRRDVCTV
ncbi:MAG: ABC transporter permease subunit [Planctomycetota bacterium]